MDPKEVVRLFWEDMRSNDFIKASQWLSENFEGIWPQSSEFIVGRSNFVEINSSYPTKGIWKFEVNSIVCEGQQVVTDVSVTDGEQKARAITFHTIENSLICKQVEFWPEEYKAPKWRDKWVKKLV